MDFDIIIIGAGAAGLLAARELTNKGIKVCLLEASDRIGGRANTIRQDGFSQPLETGAEFIHGKAPLTLALLHEANISYSEAGGEMIAVRNGVWMEQDPGNDHHEKFMQKVSSIKSDQTILSFLDDYFPEGEFDRLRSEFISFSQGFMLADPALASVFSLRDELNHLEEPQYRIQHGYAGLMDHLLRSADEKNLTVHFDSPVVRIENAESAVKIFTKYNQQFSAKGVIVTVPLKLLQTGAIEFSPANAALSKLFAKIAMGSVVKLLFQFKESFWETKNDSIGFFLSNEYIPVWWTQLPAKSALLTGWLGGPIADEANNLPGDVLYERALSSLSGIFNMSNAELRTLLVHQKIICWDQQPYTLGGYSYKLPGTELAKTELKSLTANGRILYAGEAFYEGPFNGTVEAALTSGKDAAAIFLKNFSPQ